jgi:hypothetical protein
MKLKLQLNTVVAIKKDLENRLVEYQDNIIKHNLTMNVAAFMDTLVKLQDQLVIVKEVIQNANKSKNSDGKSNNYFIYRKSNLEKFKKFLITLKDSIGVYDRNAHFNDEYIKSQKKSIESEVKTIQKKLTTFNDSKKVSVKFDDELVSLFPLLQDMVKKKK